MARIYRSASRLIAWLGPAEDGSDLAMSTLEYIGTQVVATTDGLTIPAPGARETDWCYPEKELPYAPEIWDALHCLLDREWFTRRWVIQEITLANTAAILQCGNREGPWFRFRHAVSCLGIKSSLPQAVRDGVTLASNVSLRVSESHVQRIMCKVVATQCSDKLDIVTRYWALCLRDLQLGSRSTTRRSWQICSGTCS